MANYPYSHQQYPPPLPPAPPPNPLPIHGDHIAANPQWNSPPQWNYAYASSAPPQPYYHEAYAPNVNYPYGEMPMPRPEAAAPPVSYQHVPPATTSIAPPPQHEYVRRPRSNTASASLGASFPGPGGYTTTYSTSPAVEPHHPTAAAVLEPSRLSRPPPPPAMKNISQYRTDDADYASDTGYLHPGRKSYLTSDGRQRRHHHRHHNHRHASKSDGHRRHRHHHHHHHHHTTADREAIVGNGATVGNDMYSYTTPLEQIVNNSNDFVSRLRRRQHHHDDNRRSSSVAPGDYAQPRFSSSRRKELERLEAEEERSSRHRPPVARIADRPQQDEQRPRLDGHVHSRGAVVDDAGRGRLSATRAAHPVDRSRTREAPEDRRHHHSRRSTSKYPTFDDEGSNDDIYYLSDDDDPSSGAKGKRLSWHPRIDNDDGSAGGEEPRRHRQRSSSSSSAGSSSSQRKPRKSSGIVDPAPAKRSGDVAPPKPILKTPTEKFPERPVTSRPGVAPLKEKGIPSWARWTKIKRRLVNPEALEAAGERFEERPDFVIVLRGLTKEEIQGHAEKTQQLRGMQTISE